MTWKLEQITRNLSIAWLPRPERLHIAVKRAMRDVDDLARGPRYAAPHAECLEGGRASAELYLLDLDMLSCRWEQAAPMVRASKSARERC